MGKRSEIMAQARREFEARRSAPSGRVLREIDRQYASPLSRTTAYGTDNAERRAKQDARYAQERAHAEDVYVAKGGFLGVDHFRAYIGGYLSHAAHRFAAAQADGDARECLRIVGEVRQWGEHAITRAITSGSFASLKKSRAPHEIAVEVWGQACARYGFAMAANAGGGEIAPDVTRASDAGPFARKPMSVPEVDPRIQARRDAQGIAPVSARHRVG